MRLMFYAALAATLAAAGCVTPSASAGSDHAEAFVRQVYASYREDEPWPIDEARLDEVWTPAMAALIRRDRELSGDDLPYLDADPICNCQDFEDIRVLDTRTQSNGGAATLVTVRFVNGGQETTTTFQLENTGSDGWRIADVLNADGYPSLADNLAASNARIEAGGRALGRE